MIEDVNQYSSESVGRRSRLFMEKQTINIAVIGHTNSGKSTIAGHLFHKCGGIDGRFMEECVADAEKAGKESLKYAWVFDQDAAERERGISMNASARRFESSKYSFNTIDTPGHCDFIGNMIGATSQADVAILVIDASREGYKLGFVEDGQTKEHTFLAYTLGVKQMIVVVNKMDDESVNFSEDRWKSIRTEVATFLKKVGYKPMKIPFIPISGWLGENVATKSIYMPWYGGPTLLEALDNVSSPKRAVDKPLRVPLQRVDNLEGIESVMVGRIASGTLTTAMEVQFSPGDSIDTIEVLEVNSQTVSRAVAGDIVCIKVDNKSNSMRDLRPGHVLSGCDSPAREVSSFEAQIIFMNNQVEIPVGYTIIIHCHTSQTPCTIVNIKEKMDRRTGKILEKNPLSVEAGDACIMELQPKQPLCVEPFKDCPSLGRFAVRDSKQTIAFGVVKSVTHGRVSE